MYMNTPLQIKADFQRQHQERQELIERQRRVQVQVQAKARSAQAQPQAQASAQDQDQEDPTMSPSTSQAQQQQQQQQAGSGDLRKGSSGVSTTTTTTNGVVNAKKPSGTSVGAGGGGGGSGRVSSMSSTLADLTASVRRTTGDVPPPLVGATFTVVGSKLYVFGGRLILPRTMMNDLYALDLETLVWEKIEPVSSSSSSTTNEQTVPRPRYFHSAESYKDKIIIFGGMATNITPPPPVPKKTDDGSDRDRDDANDVDPGLCVLSDVVVFDTITKVWSFPEPVLAQRQTSPPISPIQSVMLQQQQDPSSSTTNQQASTSSSSSDPIQPPSPRYAHLSCITNNCMVILGGQTIDHRYVHEINVLDIDRMVWTGFENWERHCGTYRSVAVSSGYKVHIPGSEGSGSGSGGDLGSRKTGTGAGGGSSSASGEDRRSVSPTRKRRSTNASSLGYPATASLDQPDKDGIVQLSYSAPTTSDDSEPILLFSNYNFNDVRRDLEAITPPTPPNYNIKMNNLSHLMVCAPSLPPGLRFPTGSIVGNHLIVCGTYLSHSVNALSIFALDLGKGRNRLNGKLVWQKVDIGSVLNCGASWNKAVRWRNSLVMLGDKDRDIFLDYDRRQANFTHVCFADLEAFGIYQPPPRILPPAAQQLGLTMLSRPSFADYEVQCSDGVTMGCSRAILEQRWPWFSRQLREVRNRAVGVLNARKRSGDLAGGGTSTSNEPVSASSPDEQQRRHSSSSDATTMTETALVATRTLYLPETSSVVMALLQYFYTLSLSTAHQHSLPVLLSLLLVSRTYEIHNLRALVCHALHGYISAGGANCGPIYEIATFAGCPALQIRALKHMIQTNNSRHASSSSSSKSRQSGGQDQDGRADHPSRS